MKEFVLIAVIILAGCATENTGGIYGRIRGESVVAVEGYSRSMKNFIDSGGSQEQSVNKAKEAVSNSLKDPGSAQFRNVRIGRGSVVCGDVNGKNSYGGYVGFRPFAAGTDGASLWGTDSKYPEIQAASNYGISQACD